MRARRIAVLGCAIGLVAAAPAGAATFAVTKEADTNVACAAGDCSLREAVNAANTLDGDDVVTLPAGTYVLTGAAGDDAGASGDLDVADPDDFVAIRGEGAAVSTIDGNDLDRVLDVLSTARLEISGVTIRDGKQTGGAIRNTDGDVRIVRSVLTSNESAASAGAIYSTGSSSPRVSIIDSTLSGNVAVSDGGAILNEDYSRLVITGSTLSGNAAGSTGGALYNQNQAAATIADSIVSDNDADDEGGGLATQNQASLTVLRSAITGNEAADMHGGGLWAQNQALVTVIASTVSANRVHGADADDGGAGLWAQNQAVLTVVDSTFDGNVSDHRGGAFYVRNQVWLDLVNSTVAGNQAGSDGGGVYAENDPVVALASSTLAGNAAAGAGGALYDNTTLAPDPFRLEDTILAGNTAAGAPGDCDGAAAGGTFTSAGHNLAGTGGCDLTGPGDIPNGAANLDVLADNGGPTRTMALLAGSQAIDAGSAGCPARDQRGVIRPQAAACDIGAFEAPPPAPPATVPPGTPPGPGPPVAAADVVKPVISGFALSPRAFRAARRGGSVGGSGGTRVSLTLSEPATLRFRVRRATRGRRVGGRCVKATRRNAGRRRCRRFVLRPGAFTVAGTQGANAFRFTGRLAGRSLGAGAYRLVVVATDAAGNRSASKSVGFTVRRPRRA